MPRQALEALLKVVHSLFDEEPKPHLHVGEAMACWTYLTILDETVSLEQLSLNTTTDPELKSFLHQTMAGASSQAERLKVFLQEEGVPLPPVSEPKPYSNPDGIPLGAKMTDDQIANLVRAKLTAAITTSAAAVASSVRHDVAMMFFEFQTEAMRYAALESSLMRKRGWLKIPPYYYPPGSTNMK